MSARKDDAYTKVNKQTPRYHTIFGNSKYYPSSILNKTGEFGIKKHLITNQM